MTVLDIISVLFVLGVFLFLVFCFGFKVGYTKGVKVEKHIFVGDASGLYPGMKVDVFSGGDADKN